MPRFRLKPKKALNKVNVSMKKPSNVSKPVDRTTAKNNISKALGKKDSTIKQNNNTAANNIANESKANDIKKEQLNNAVEKGKEQIKQDAQKTSEKTNQQANVIKSQAITGGGFKTDKVNNQIKHDTQVSKPQSNASKPQQMSNEKYKTEADALKKQHKLDVKDQTYKNKLDALKNKQQNALQIQQNKHNNKMEQAKQHVEMKKQTNSLNYLNKQNAKQKAHQNALNQKLSLQEQKAKQKLELQEQKAAQRKQDQQRKTDVRNANKYVDIDQVKANRSDYDKINKTGLSIYEKWKYNKEIKRDMNNKIKMAKAGLDPSTGKPIQPTVVGQGQTAVLPNGQPVGGTSTQIVPVQGGNSSNGFDKLVQLGMLSQMFGGSGNSGHQEAPNGVPADTAAEQPIENQPQEPTTQDTPAANNTTSSSHIPAGGINININSNKTNHIWSGLLPGSNNNSSNTQAGSGTVLPKPNNKPSHSNSNALTGMSQTGPSFSGWLV